MAGGTVHRTTFDVSFSRLRRILADLRPRVGVRVLILGSGPEVAGLALRYRAARGVLVVGTPAPADVEKLHQAGIRVRARLTTPRLTRALATAETVFVAGADDTESNLLARAAAQAAGTAAFPSATLFDEPAAALAWDHQGHHAIARAEALALAALRMVPPWPSDRATPPPVVIGDTPVAAEIARRIAVGWQQPGERHLIHRIVRDRACVGPLPPPAQGEVDEASDPESVVRSVTLRCTAWPTPPATHATVAGPTIYVASQDEPHAVGALLAERISDARVCIVADAPPERRSRPERRHQPEPRDRPGHPNEPEHPAPNLVVVSRREHLADPAVLLLTPERLLAEEVFAEASYWPADLPSLFGVLTRDAAEGVRPLAAQPAAVQEGVAGVAALADDLLRDLGVLLDAPEQPSDHETLVPRSSANVVLMPDELAAIADRLVAATPAPDGVDPAEHRRRAIEFAARLPALLARAGRHPRRPPGHPDLLAGLPEWAANVHAQYRLTVQRTGAAGHANAERCWEDLHPFEQQSNRAQLVDIPVKLAAVGLDCRPVIDPEAALFALTDDIVDRLAELEHRRWEHFQRRNGRSGHRLAVPWEDLTEEQRGFDRDAVRAIPHILRFVGLDIIAPHAPEVAAPTRTTTAGH